MSQHCPRCRDRSYNYVTMGGITVQTGTADPGPGVEAMSIETPESIAQRKGFEAGEKFGRTHCGHEAELEMFSRWTEHQDTGPYDGCGCAFCVLHDKIARLQAELAALRAALAVADRFTAQVLDDPEAQPGWVVFFAKQYRAAREKVWGNE